MKSLSMYITRGKKYNTELDKLRINIKRELIAHDCCSFNDILFCEAKGSYSQIYTIHGKKIMITCNLKYLEKYFPIKDFIRCHKSFLINLNHIQDILGPEPCYIILSDGKKIKVSCRKKTKIFKVLGIRNN